MFKLSENNKKYKQIIKYKHITKQINKNNSIKPQKCIDKYPQQCYYKTIKNNKRKTKKENHSIHSIDAHEGWRKEKVIPVGTWTNTIINMRVTGTGFPARKTWYINYPLFIPIITEHSKEIFKILPGEQDFQRKDNLYKSITGI